MQTEKKKLLIASDAFLPRWDGVSRFLAEVVPRLSSEYEITLVVPDYGKKINVRNVELVRIPIHKFRIGDYNPPKFNHVTIKKLVKKADIIFTQTIGPIGFLSIYYASRMKKPIYAFTHSIEWELVSKSIAKCKKLIESITKKVARYAYNKCSIIFVPSEDTRDVLDKNGIKPEKRVVPLGVDSSEFSPAKDKEAAKKNAGIDPDSTVIGFVGRIGREKDLPTLYKAFRLLKKDHSGIKLMIVGSGLRLESIFDDMDDVVHIESTNKPADYYRAIDIFVMPSLTETSSLSTMEAMSCGLPVIATKVGNIKNYIKDSKNGYLFPERNYEALASKISKLLGNMELAKGIGLMARKTITERFSWEKTIREIKKALG